MTWEFLLLFIDFYSLGTVLNEAIGKCDDGASLHSHISHRSRRTSLHTLYSRSLHLRTAANAETKNKFSQATLSFLLAGKKQSKLFNRNNRSSRKLRRSTDTDNRSTRSERGTGNRTRDCLIKSRSFNYRNSRCIRERSFPIPICDKLIIILIRYSCIFFFRW